MLCETNFGTFSTFTSNGILSRTYIYSFLGKRCTYHRPLVIYKWATFAVAFICARICLSRIRRLWFSAIYRRHVRESTFSSSTSGTFELFFEKYRKQTINVGSFTITFADIRLKTNSTKICPQCTDDRNATDVASTSAARHQFTIHTQ